MKKTNKTFKRFAAITSASLLAACAMAPVFTSMTSYAAQNEITFTGEAAGTHSYTAIKVFSGEAGGNNLVGDAVSPITKAELTSLDWAVEGANAEAKQTKVGPFLTALANSTVLKTGENADFTATMTAAEVAGVLKGYDSDSTKAREFAKIVVDNKDLFTNFGPTTAQNTNLAVSEDGYYVIEETTLTPTEDGDGSYTAYILGVYDASAGTEINVKSAIPTFQKKIKDTNDSATKTENDAEVWQDSADYDIGDYVPFQLKATLPENYSYYESYKLIFHDDLNKAGDPAVDVFTMDNVAKNSVVVYVDLNMNGKFDSDEALGDDDYTVIYNATAPVEKDGYDCDFEVLIPDLVNKKTGISKNTPVYVEYKALLNENAVIGNPGNWNDAYLEYSNNPNVGASGTMSETAIDSVVAFTYKVEINKKDGTTGTALTGANFVLEKLSVGTGENGADEWKPISQVEASPGSTFTFKGLDDGEYRLKETLTPANYNEINDMYFTVSASHAATVNGKTQNGILTSLTGTNKSVEYTEEGSEDVLSSAIITLNSMVADDNGVNGGLTANVLNFSGTELPGTGGIGTTIFYLGGGAMAAIGGIYLISKRRMRKSEE